MERPDDRPAAGPAAGRGGAARASALLVVAAALLAYANTLGVPFILDDLPHILDNPLLRDPGPPWRALLHSTRPLVELTLVLNHAVSGRAPWSYHLLNLALHAATGLALLALARATLERPGVPPAQRGRALPLATAIALLWVVHPLGTQAVTYVIQRAEVLAALFTLLVLLGLARAAGAPRPGRWAAFAVACCALGMASKQVMVAAPVLALAYDRVFLADSWRELGRRRGLLHAMLFGTLLLLPLFLTLDPREWGASAGFAIPGVTPLRYAAAQPQALAHYLRLAFWPDAPCLDPGWPAAPGPATLGLLLALPAGIAAATSVLLVRGRRAGFLGLAFLLLLAPTSSLIPTADPVFEHRMYLPLAAVIAATVLAADALLRRLARRGGRAAEAGGRLAVALLALAVVALAVRTFQRNRDYTSALSIWSDTVVKSPRHARPRNNLALALLEAGRFDEAMREFRRALVLDPDFAAAHLNLGRLLYRQGRHAEAQPHLAHAVRLDPGNPHARTNLGLSLVLAGRHQAGAAELARAVRLDPESPEAQAGLGIALAALGRDREAVERFQRALLLRPGDPAVRVQLGVAYRRLGRWEEARRELRAALALDPANHAVREFLADSLRPPGGEPQSSKSP